MDDHEILMTLVGSINVAIEEYIGTDLYLKLTIDHEFIYPNIFIPFKIAFLDRENVLNICTTFKFPANLIIKDEWLDILIEEFSVQHPECKILIGAITSFQDILYYRNFVKEYFD